MNSISPAVSIDQSDMRRQILARFAGIFERQVRARQYAQNINELVNVTHAEVMELLQKSVSDIDTAALPPQEKHRIARKLQLAVERFTRLGATLDLLLSDQLQQWQFTQSGLRQVMSETNRTAKALGRTLAELEYHSTHDPLTGLHNRRYFNEVLQAEQARSQRFDHEFSVLMIDLDDFKDINDTYGHPCGDEVLQRVAEVIRLPMRVGDYSARIGGDEFAIILAETGALGARTVAEKLRQQIRDLVFRCKGTEEFRTTASIGVITYPADAQSLSDLIAGADQNLYRAKKQGKDSVISIASVQDVVKLNRSARGFVEKLRSSLIEDRVIPHYQPIVRCSDGGLFAYEALARIREPNGNLISAAAFINAAEKYGLIRDFDRVMIRRAFTDLVAHINAHGSRFQLFLNLSAQEIQSRGILRFAEQLCIELGVPPNAVVFEITERDAINDMAHIRSFLEELRRKGFLFALDDFGSGYNSFHYLRELEFDFVKIDGAFVRNILNSRADQILVHNLSRLCQDLGILTIAEFVESESVLRLLREMGINYVQGFHIGHPGAHFLA